MNIIHAYTREQAIADGILIDVTPTAKECGIRYHTVLTDAVWSRYVDLPDDHESGMDREGRLWDILFMFSTTARQTSAAVVQFQVFALDSPREAYRNVTLKGICGPGDDAEPVVTIMFPHED